MLCVKDVAAEWVFHEVVHIGFTGDSQMFHWSLTDDHDFSRTKTSPPDATSTPDGQTRTDRP